MMRHTGRFQAIQQIVRAIITIIGIDKEISDTQSLVMGHPIQKERTFVPHGGDHEDAQRLGHDVLLGLLYGLILTCRLGWHRVKQTQKHGSVADKCLVAPRLALYMGLMRHLVPFLPKHPTVAVVRLQGAIGMPGRSNTLSDAGVAPLLEKAFRRRKPAAVALAINSPGGSAAQSSLIAARIRRLAAETDIKVYAFVEDVAASGGYWLATAADEIWADDNSIVGSIGVISASFGFEDFISRYGITRRVHTAGKSKSMLDPFQPEKAADIKRLKSLQTQIHENFIAQVKQRRGARLAEGDLFTGDIWVGTEAEKIGLIDGIGHLVPKMKDIFGDKVQFARYQQRRGFPAFLSTGLIDATATAVEERAQFARFGL